MTEKYFQETGELLFFFFSLFLLFLEPNTQYMEIPRLGVELEPQLPPCTTARSELCL